MKPYIKIAPPAKVAPAKAGKGAGPKAAGVKAAGSHTNPSGSPAAWAQRVLNGTGISGAGAHTDPTGKAAPWANGKNKAVAAAKAHAAKATGGAAVSTNPLAPLSAAQIKAQAKSTIGAAYASSFGDLKNQQSQDASINAKRQQDDAAYQNWASGQEQQILAQGSAADANFAAASASANQSLAAAAPQSAALVAQADAQQGNVSNNSTSTQIGAGGAVDRATSSGLANAAIGRNLDIGNVQDSSDLLRENAINANSRIGDNEAGQTASYQTALSALAAQHSKLQLSKAGDIAKEIARLQGVEIQKAQSAEQIKAAEEQLNFTAKQDAVVDGQNAAKIQNTAASIVERQNVSNAELAKDKYVAQLEANSSMSRAQLEAATSMSNAQLEAASRDKTFRLDQQKLGVEKAAQIWKEQHPTEAHAGNPGGSPETANEQNEIYNQIDETRGTINGLYSQYQHNGGSQTVYQALANGTALQVGTKTLASGKTEPIMKTFPRVPTAVLNAAFDLSHWRTGLTPKDIAQLNALGLRNVSSHY